ncbi:hypothetical protein, partial [Vibrio parahaemolyticus]|uniref:hypothetical protein n=1 Tax=Vibrio parahaemolyticus TaxID=670 RepID=UPI001E456749
RLGVYLSKLVGNTDKIYGYSCPKRDDAGWLIARQRDKSGMCSNSWQKQKEEREIKLDMVG